MLSGQILLRILSNFICCEKCRKAFRREFLINSKKKDYRLTSGERQTATTLDGIRKDHIERYNLVLEYIKQFDNKRTNVLDMFCGNGYGSFLLSSNLAHARFLSIDGSSEAIKCANVNYKTPNIKFKRKLFPFRLKQNEFDFVISLESIEHVEDDIAFIKFINKSLKKGGILFLSTPNAEKQSLEINPNHFHYRHYINTEILNILRDNGFELIKQYGQDVYIIDDNGKCTGLVDASQMGLIEDYDGQFCIFILRKVS
jgi:2-polyprenyl-3-methyl-5-hydroxy-6-metoxy-1,4-benzoquinol methylase